MLPNILSTLFFFATAAVAAPVIPMPIPPPPPTVPLSLDKRALVTRIKESNSILGYDAHDSTYHLYDRNNTYLGALPAHEAAPHLRRRDDFSIPNGCFLMTNDQVSGLSGFNAYQDKRKQCWGDGKGVQFTNVGPDGKEVAKAFRCFDGPEFVDDLQPQGDPTCETSDASVEGESDGSDTQIVFTYTTGSTTTASHSVTNAVEVAIGQNFEATVGIKGIASATATTSINLKYDHSDNRITTEEKKEEHSFQLTYNNQDSKKCKMTFQTDSCKQNAKGNIRTKAGGFIWYTYDEFVGPKADGCGDGTHRTWGFPLGMLNDEERTVRTGVDSVVSHSLTAKYKVECDGDAPADFKTVDPNQDNKVTEGPGANSTATPA
ncbi:hypothetical protein DL96DRAFT_520793 [Flagelloscypha sp. PMI_526]|nr:hypothetical protein DL96DRAFT_520793 [Flagelloscypha sp. PMI_526]